MSLGMALILFNLVVSYGEIRTDRLLNVARLGSKTKRRGDVANEAEDRAMQRA